MSPLRGALMVCGTASDVGKSQVVTGLCRALARRGVGVAPFKAQNMALNSIVTSDGAEIGRAQHAQAVAAGVEPEAAMNPVLLKPTDDRTSQVIVMGRPWKTLGALDYHRAKAELAPVVLEALDDLRRRFDVVLCEGAGSPAEVNLIEHDIVNLGLARRAGIPAVLVGDIDRGGVFAHLLGTVALLPDELRPCVRGFVVNKFRGDRRLLGDATAVLAARTGLPTMGVLPYLAGLGLDAEDSMALSGAGGAAAPEHRGDVLDVAVVRFPRLSNFTDLDPLQVEPGVAVRFVERPSALRHADLVILPGTKSTVADLSWLQRTGLAGALDAARRGPRPPAVLGICGGYQMLGRTVRDPLGVEAPPGDVDGLGLLPLVTEFERGKVTRRVEGTDRGGHPVAGYEIHHGRPRPDGGSAHWLELEDGPEGQVGGGRAGAVYGTSVHGLLEADRFRAAFLTAVSAGRGLAWEPSGLSFAGARQDQIDRVADACEEHLDLEALWSIVAEGAPVGR